MIKIYPRTGGYNKSINVWIEDPQIRYGLIIMMIIHLSLILHIYRRTM